MDSLKRQRLLPCAFQTMFDASRGWRNDSDVTLTPAGSNDMLVAHHINAMQYEATDDVSPIIVSESSFTSLIIFIYDNQFGIVEELLQWSLCIMVVTIWP